MTNVNGFEGVPWMVGGGAKHSPALGRAVAHAASQGGEGIVLPTDLKVAARATPTTAVDMAPGQVFIKQKAANVAAQSYLGYAPGTSQIDAPPSDTTARSYLVVVEIMDPQFPGYSAYPSSNPDAVANGPYVRPTLYGPVPANTISARQIPALASKAFYAPARLDIPANTTTITNQMIVDLRKLGRPRGWLEPLYGDRSGLPNLNMDPNANWLPFPEYAPSVLVPEWATDFRQTVTITAVHQFNATTKGNIRAMLGTIGGSSAEVNLVAANGTAYTMIAGNGGDCSAYQGQMLTAASQAKLTEGGLFVTSGCQIMHNIWFYEKVR